MNPQRDIGDIGDIVEDFLRAVREGLAPAIDAVCARHPEHGAELRELLEAAASLEGVRPAHASAPTADPRRLGRFRIVREIGRGGMGVVYEAIQEPLERRVALKVLPAARFANPADRKRFEREAELAARIDDPGICTVYESGIEDGQAYIAMRFVEGETLSARIEATRALATDSSSTAVRLEQESPAAASDGRGRAASDEHKVARLVGRIARTLGTAHDKNLVHRDVKPANIMITPAGEPVVLDFGLARDDDAEVLLTQTGELCGTPAYMSPEQVQGKRDAIDRRTDVYQLGVTLYECLTLRRPFEARVRAALYRAILQDEPDDPRAWNPALAADLAAITLRALEKDPRLRYGSATDFALDLERFERGEPVVARPISGVERVRRRIRAHPWRAAALGLLAFTVVGGPIAWGVHVASKLGAVRAEEARTGKERARADKSYERARSTAGRLIDRVRAERFRGGAVSRELERDLLGQAIGIYTDFLAVNGDDSSSRLDLCAAYIEVGKLHTKLRDLEAAALDFAHAIDIASDGRGEGASADSLEPGASHRARGLLADAHLQRGLAHGHAENTLAAEADLRRALELLETPGADAAGRESDARTRNAARFTLARHRLHAGDTGAGVAQMRDAARELDEYVQRDPAPAWALVAASNARGEAALALAALANMQEAEAESRAAVELAQRALDSDPTDLDALEMAGNQTARAGNLAYNTGRLGESEAYFATAVEIQARLAAAAPGSIDHAVGLALYLKNLGSAQWFQGCAHEAEITWRRALELRERLWREHGDLPASKEDLSASLTDLAFLVRIDRPAEARALFTRAAELCEEVFELAPDSPARQSILSNIVQELAATHARLGDHENAAPFFERAVALREDLVQRFPDVPDYRCDLGMSLANLGQHENELGHGPEAIAWWERGFEQQVQAFDLNPRNPQYELMLFQQGKQLAEGLLQTDASARLLAVIDTVSSRVRTRQEFHHLASYYVALAHETLAAREPLDAAIVQRARETCLRELTLALDFGRTNVATLLADKAFDRLRTDGALTAIEERLQRRGR